MDCNLQDQVNNDWKQFCINSSHNEIDHVTGDMVNSIVILVEMLSWIMKQPQLLWSSPITWSISFLLELMQIAFSHC